MSSVTVAALVVVACGGPNSYHRPDITVLVVPKDAFTLPFPKSLITEDEMDFMGVQKAQMQRNASGIVQLKLFASERYYIGNNFGGATAVIAKLILCYDINLSGKTATITGYKLMSEPFTGDSNACATFPEGPEQGQLPDAVSTAFKLGDGAQPAHAGLGDSTLKEAIAMPTGFLASVETVQATPSNFPDLAFPSTSRNLVVRSRGDTLAVNLSPDSLDFVAKMTSTSSATGTDYFWRSRDERIYRLSTTSTPLAMQYLGIGAANLIREGTDVAALGTTVANLVEGDQWTALFQTQFEAIRLSIRTNTVASSAFVQTQPFVPMSVLTPHPRTMWVCFCEQLDQSSVSAASFSFDPPMAVQTVELFGSNLCVSVGTAARENRPYRVTVKGVRSVFGNSLPPGGVLFTLNRAPNSLIDFRSELLNGVIGAATMAPTTDGAAVAMMVDSTGTTLWHATPSIGFATHVTSYPGQQLKAVEDRTGHGFWFLSGLGDAGVAQISHLEGREVDSLPVSSSVVEVITLGDGSAVLRTDDHTDSRVVGGAIVPLPAVLQAKRVTGFVPGSSDVMVNDGAFAERRKITDGALVASYALSEPVLVAVDDYLCATKLYRALADGGVTGLTGDACRDLMKTPGGQVLATTTNSRAFDTLWRAQGDVATELRILVAAQPGNPQVTRPRFIGDGVYFTAETTTGGQGLELASTAQWQALTDGGVQ